MKLCSNECVPCCDFCIHAIHWEADGITLSVEGCSLHLDDEHQKIAQLCYFCEDFHCFDAKED